VTFLKKHFSSLFCVFLILYVAQKQIPLWRHSNNQVGTSFSKLKAQGVQNQTWVSLPIEGERAVYIFWATWCGPCHLQLSQFERSVVEDKLPSDRVKAISLDQSREDLKIFLEKNKYSFKVFHILSKQKWTDFNVQATPTVVFVDELGHVFDFFTGLSPLAVYKAQNFLK